MALPVLCLWWCAELLCALFLQVVWAWPHPDWEHLGLVLSHRIKGPFSARVFFLSHLDTFVGCLVCLTLVWFTLHNTLHFIHHTSASTLLIIQTYTLHTCIYHLSCIYHLISVNKLFTFLPSCVRYYIYHGLKAGLRQIVQNNVGILLQKFLKQTKKSTFSVADY